MTTKPTAQENAAPQVEETVVENDELDDDVDLSFLKDVEEDSSQETPESAAADADSSAAEQTPQVEEEKKEEKAAVAETRPTAEPSPPPATEAVAQPQQQPVAQQQQELADGAAAQAAFEQAALEKISEYFKLSDDEKESIVTEPEKVMPRLAAKVLLRTVQTSVDAIKALLPQVLAQHSEQRNIAQRAEEQFYEAWPELKDKEEAKAVIVQHANFFRSMYPNASMEDVVKNVGASVMVAMGVQRQAQPTAGLATAQQAGGNGSQVVRRESLPPYRPAASTPPRELAQPVVNNVFEAMALDSE